MLEEEAGGGQEDGQELQQVLPLHDVPLDPQGEALADNSMGKMNAFYPKFKSGNHE